MSKTTNTAKRSLPVEFQMGLFQEHQFLAISDYSTVTGTPKHIRDWLISSVVDSHAKISVAPEKALASPGRDLDYGQKWPQPFAQYNHGVFLSKTAQCSQNGSGQFSGTWPRWGIMQFGECWEVLRPDAASTESACGCSLQRPIASDSRRLKLKLTSLQRWNHPNGNLSEQLAQCYQKRLTPESAEILLSWPVGWTDSEPLAMDKFQLWLQQHSGF